MTPGTRVRLTKDLPPLLAAAEGVIDRMASGLGMCAVRWDGGLDIWVTPDYLMAIDEAAEPIQAVEDKSDTEPVPVDLPLAEDAPITEEPQEKASDAEATSE